MDFSTNTLGMAIIFVAGIILFIIFFLVMLNKFLVKSFSGQALVVTGFGITQPKISLSSAFVIPLFNKVQSIDLTVKIVKIERKGNDSLSCSDGIRAEVEVDFYIQINSMEEDIRRVASTVGCERASDIKTLRELFEAKFADALKTAGAKLTFDQLYQNRGLFRDEILKALGQAGSQSHDVVLNGYKLDDVAIQYLEQLPLARHNEDNVLDAKGRKEIAQRTSAEAEAANKRLRTKEVTISEQNREATLRQLEISQDLAEKEAKQEREIKEARSRENSLAEQTLAEQERLSVEAGIAKEKSIKIAEERKQQEIISAQITREESVQVQSTKTKQAIEIARIQKEMAEAEAMKQKLIILEATAIQEAEKIKAEENALTVRALEIANRQKQTEVIDAQKQSEVQIQIRKVESDVKSYEIITVAKAKLDSAVLDAQAAELQARAIVELGKADSEALKLKLEAQNVINERVLLANVLKELVPLLPTIIEKLMIPAEKIESIKVLNVNGMDKLMPGISSGEGKANGQAGSGNGIDSIINSVVGVGMVLPLLKEVMGVMHGNDTTSDFLKQLGKMPGGESLLKYLGESAKETEIV